MMKDKTLYTLCLGDRTVTLAFKVGTLRRLKALLGKDPFEALKGADTVEVLEYARALTEAAMLAYDTTADVSSLEDEFDKLSIPEAKAIVNAWTLAMTDTTPEGGKDTQPGEAADAG